MEESNHHFKRQMQAFKANTVRTMTNPRMGVVFDTSRRTKQKAFIQNWIRDLKQVTAELSQLKHLAWFIKNNIPVPARVKVEFGNQYHSRIAREIAILDLEDNKNPEPTEEASVPLHLDVSIVASKFSNRLFA